MSVLGPTTLRGSELSATAPLLHPSTQLVVVAPHPDDEVLGFGGALFDHMSAGGSATLISVSNGEASDNAATDGQQQRLVLRRRAERAAALHLLGADTMPIVEYDLPDGELASREVELRERLTATLAAYDPDTSRAVICPWRFDEHPDHQATGRAASAAAGELGVACYEVPIWSWFNDASLRRGELRFVSITNAAMHAKRAALACFTSQLEPLSGERGSVLPEGFMDAFVRPFEPLLP